MVSDRFRYTIQLVAFKTKKYVDSCIAIHTQQTFSFRQYTRTILYYSIYTLNSTIQGTK